VSTVNRSKKKGQRFSADPFFYENLRSWYAQYTQTLLALNKPCLFLPTGEGVPSKIEGVGGVFWMGLRGKIPLTVWQRQGLNLFAKTGAKQMIKLADRFGKSPRRAFYCDA